MTKITTVLWFDGAAEEAAAFYVSLLPDSRIERVLKSPVDTPSAPAGTVLTVDFTIAGRHFSGLNGGPHHPHSDAVSIMVHTEDQAETDRLWDALIGGGGSAIMCGWCRDKWGVRWQITPQRLLDLIADPDPARAARAMEAMMGMTKIDIAALEAAVADDRAN